MKRMFAGSIIVLLLSVSSFAMACDVSCGLSQLQSDCHSARLASQNSFSTDTKMDGMEMDGMAMPATSNDRSADLQIVLAPFPSDAHHAFVGEMGPCERQSCDQDASDISKSTRIITPQFHTLLTIVHFPQVDGLQTIFYNPREDIAVFDPNHRFPLSISLRV